MQETLEVAVSRHFPEVSGSKGSGSVQLLVQCAAVRPHTLFGNIVYGNVITRNGDYGSESSCWGQTGGKGNQTNQTVVITQAQASSAFPALPLPSSDTASPLCCRVREGATRSLILKVMEEQRKAVT